MILLRLDYNVKVSQCTDKTLDILFLKRRAAILRKASDGCSNTLV